MPILKVGELDLISHSAEQTLRLGARLGALLAPGHLICLSGEMGAGKTVFCNGLGQGWGAFEPLVSHTYTIVHQHHRDSDQALLYHLDCYRLNSADDADSIEFDDLLDSGAVLLIEWPEKIAEIQAVTKLPVWVSEVGVSTFGAEEVQEFGLRRTAELLRGRAPRVHWYSLYDLPRAWPATTRHREAEGSSYYRHFSITTI